MIPGIEIQLADGKTYVFPPLALASLETLQERLAEFRGGTDKESLNTVVAATMHSLRRNYPTLTRKDVLGEFHEDENGDIVWDRPPLLDLNNMLDVMQAAMDVSGVRRKAIDAEKALASKP